MKRKYKIGETVIISVPNKNNEYLHNGKRAVIKGTFLRSSGEYRIQIEGDNYDRPCSEKNLRKMTKLDKALN